MKRTTIEAHEAAALATMEEGIQEQAAGRPEAPINVQWIHADTSLPNSRKIKRLSSALECSRHEAIGIAITFWLAASNVYEDGQLFDEDTPEDIAQLAQFRDDPEKLWQALQAANIISIDRKIVRWDDYQGKAREYISKNRGYQRTYRARTRQ